MNLFIDDPTPAADGCCALDEGHDGACAWICSECNGSNHCWACGGPSGDDLGTGCEVCDGTGSCFHCYEGMESDDDGPYFVTPGLREVHPPYRLPGGGGE